MNTIGRILDLSSNQKKTLIQAAGYSVADALLDLVPYYVMYLVVLTCIQSEAAPGEMAQLAIIALVAICTRAYVRWKAESLAHIAGYNVLRDIRCSIAQHIGKLPMLFFSRNTSGGLLKTMGEDVERIETLLSHNMPDLCASIAAPLFTTGLLFWIDWRLGLAALIPFILAVLSQMAMFRACSTRMQSFHDSLTDMNGTIVEYVQGIIDIKAFNQTTSSFTRFTQSVGRFEHIVKDWSLISCKYYALFGTALGSGLLFVLPPGVILLSRGNITIADLVLVLMLVTGYATPLDRLLRFSSKLREIEEGMHRIDAILNEPPLASSQKTHIPTTHNISFNNVSFAYEEDSRLFNHLNLEIPAGTLTAFVGPSGAGKTTAAMLVSRYQDIQEGSISIGGVDVRDIPLEALLDMISFVFQDTFLFSDSIMENIRIGSPQADDAAVVAAAKQARAHEFISSLPQGYQTQTGDGGIPLSGGEKQRISIARAILRNSPIVILDEATAYADPENEALLQEAVSKLLTGKTVIVIGHRLQALTESDTIVVFDQGTIAGTGRHEDLLESCLLYAKLWYVQANSADWALAAKKEALHAKSA